MKNAEHTQHFCLTSEQTVAFLYKEMPAAEIALSELHLADCVKCADEFAEMAIARLEVYEWQRDEFSKMATPVISIPFEASAQPRKVFWLDALRGPFASFPKLVTGAAFAVIAIGLSITFFVSNDTDKEIVRGIPVDAPIPSQQAPGNNLPQPIQSTDRAVSADNELARSETLDALDKTPKMARPVERLSGTSFRVKQSRKAKVSDAQIAERTVSPGNTLPANAPRLNNFDDEEDNTLRLADLFAELEAPR